MVRPLSIYGEKPLKSALTSLLKHILNERDRLLITLNQEWGFIVGDDVARYTRPIEVKFTKTERILTLGVTPAMNTLVAHQETELLERINQFLGQGKITRLKISTKGL